MRPHAPASIFPVIRRRRRGAIALASLLAALAPGAPALALDLVDLYAGGSIGRAQIEADPSHFLGPASGGSFSHGSSAYKVMAGIRPISWVGAEAEYVDLGHPVGAANFSSTTTIDGSTKGFAAFGMLYLPVPVVDVFLKAGLGRMDSHVNLSACSANTCQIASASPHDTGFAGGAGVQFKLGAWSARAEYEIFDAMGRTPYLYSIGLTWSFL